MRELGGKYIYHKWSEKEINWEIKGRYEGTRVDNYGKEPFIIVDEDGGRHSLNACGSLNYKMEFAEKGDKLLIRYMGTEPVKTNYGLKDVHQFKVFNLDDEDLGPDDTDEADTSALGLDAMDAGEDTLDMSEFK